MGGASAFTDRVARERKSPQLPPKTTAHLLIDLERCSDCFLFRRVVMRLRVSVLVLVGVFVAATSARAQGLAGSKDPASGQVSGSVSDRTGGALPGAIV